MDNKALPIQQTLTCGDGGNGVLPFLDCLDYLANASAPFSKNSFCQL